MALETQLLELPFQSGIDQKVDARWLTVGNQTSVTNGRFVKAGAIHKRFGYTALRKVDTDGDDLDITGRRLQAHNDSPLLIADINGTNVALYAYAATTTAWKLMDNVPDCNAWHYGVAEWSTTTSNYDSCVCNGYLVVVYTAQKYNATAYVVFCSVIDLANGTYVMANQIIDDTGGKSFTYAKCLAQGTDCVIVYKDATTTTDIWAITISLAGTSIGIGSATKIVSDYDLAVTGVQRHWDIAPIVGGTDWVILYPSYVNPTASTTIRQFNVSLAQIARADIATPGGGAYVTPGRGYAIYADTNNVWFAVIYDDTANEALYVGSRTPDTLTQILVLTASGFTYTGPGNDNRVGIVAVNSTKAIVITSGQTSTRWKSITTGAVLGTARQMFNYDIASKPFLAGTQWLCLLACQVSLTAYTQITPIVSSTAVSPQGAYQLIDLMQNSTSSSASVGRVIANLAPRLANTNQSVWTTTTPTAVYAIDSYNWITVGSVISTTSTRLGLRALQFSFEKDRWNGVQLGPSLYLSGGVPTSFDGQQVTEIGFMYPPPTISVGQSTTGPGALTLLGTYTYYVAYIYINAQGERQLSAASITAAALTTTNNTVTLTITQLSNTLKQDPENGFSPPVGIEIWRNANGGSTFYQLQSDSLILANQPTTISRTYTDTKADASLPSLNNLPAPIWPYQGGALEGYCPPAFQKIVAYNLRLWGIGDDRQTLWYSTAYIQGEQPRFNDNFTLNIGENITGLEVMDGALYVFTATGILRLAGNGPNEEGAGNDIQQPDVVPSDVGCIESRSIVATALGIFYQASTGIYLLARGGEPQYVGQAVEDQLATYPVVKAATLVPGHTEVRFECSTAEVSEVGVTLVYNYTFKAWSVFDKYDDDFATALTPAVSAVSVGGVYYWLTSTGRVYQENSDETATDAFLDGTTWVTLSVESAWARSGGIQSWSRFRNVNVLCENNDPHDLVVSVGTDFADTYNQTHAFTAQEMLTWTTPMEAAEVQIGKQKAAALRVKISDSSPTHLHATTGQGPTLVGLQLEVGTYPRPYRIPPKQGA